MLTSTVRIICLVALVSFAAADALGQTSAPRNQLAVSIRFADMSGGYQLPEPSKKGGIWWERFPRVPGWVPAANSLPVTAVHVTSQQAEGGVRVWVSVYLGNLHEEEKQVSAYVLREGDKVSVKELADLGVVPIDLKAVRMSGSGYYTPRFRSDVSSVELVAIQPNPSVNPTVQLVVRNVSAKPIYALYVRVGSLVHGPTGEDGEALIAPGETAEIKISMQDRSVSADGYQREVLPNQTVNVTTAVFVDGSYEGDSDGALGFIGVKKGRKIQLGRVIDLLEQTANGSKDVAWLKSKLTALSLDADPAAVDELYRQFPQPKPFERPRTLIQIGMTKMRDDVLKELSEFELHMRFKEANAFNAWLTSSKQRYQAWFSRM